MPTVLPSLAPPQARPHRGTAAGRALGRDCREQRARQRALRAPRAALGARAQRCVGRPPHQRRAVGARRAAGRTLFPLHQRGRRRPRFRLRRAAGGGPPTAGGGGRTGKGWPPPCWPRRGRGGGGVQGIRGARAAAEVRGAAHLNTWLCPEPLPHAPPKPVTKPTRPAPPRPPPQGARRHQPVRAAPFGGRPRRRCGLHRPRAAHGPVRGGGGGRAPGEAQKPAARDTLLSRAPPQSSRAAACPQTTLMRPPASPAPPAPAKGTTPRLTSTAACC
jgi:hypothetical protein